MACIPGFELSGAQYGEFESWRNQSSAQIYVTWECSHVAQWSSTYTVSYKRPRLTSAIYPAILSTSR